jgi:hypothetical protein
VTSASASGGTSTGGSDLPNALACHIESTAMFAAQAAERGDLEAAKELLHAAVRAVEAVEARPTAGLRVVGNVGGAA